MTDMQSTTADQTAADIDADMRAKGETFAQRLARRGAEAAVATRHAIAVRNRRLGEIVRADRVIRVIDLTAADEIDADTGAYVIEVPPFSRTSADQRNMFFAIVEGVSDRQPFYSRALATLHAVGQLDGDSHNDMGAAASFAARAMGIDTLA